MKKVYLFISVFLSFIPSIAQTLLSENFDGASFPPTGWTIINVSGAGLGWVDNNNANLAWAPYAAYSGTGSMVNEYDQAINANTWAISPSIPLSAGTGYSVTFYYKVEDNLYPEKMKVTVGNGASVAAQTTVLWNNNGDTSLTNTNWVKGMVLYTPTVSGNYNFAFNCYSNADQFAITVDDVKIEVAPTSLPNCTSLISPVNNSTGVATQPTFFNWNSVANTSGYIFYLGTNPIPDSLGFTQDTSISFSGLNYNTVYYWSVVPSNILGNASGCVVDSFTTGNPPPPPSNDNCTGAISLVNMIPVNGTTIGATESQAAEACNGFTGNANDDVWYSFTTNQTGDVTVKVVPNTSFDAVIIAYTGTCGSLTTVGCSDNGIEGETEVYTFSNLAANQTCYIRVYGYYGQGSEGTFTINDSGSALLPVTIIYFAGERKNKMDVLSWTTATEINNKGFEVQHSVDGIIFNSLAMVLTKAREGNSVAKINYEFVNEKTLAVNSYYRLKQIDKDGKSKYSSILFIKGDEQSKLVLHSIYPNPVKSKLNLSVFSPNNEFAHILINDLAGKNVRNQLTNIVKGQNNISLNVADLMPGTYLVKMITHSGENAVSKFIKE